MPNVFADVIAFNSVNDVLLINSASKGEDVIVLEGAQCNTRSGNSQRVDLLPLVLLNVVNLTEPVNLAVNESTHHIDKSLDGTKGVVCVREDHRGLLVHIGEDLVVPIALLQVLVLSLVAPADQVDSTVLSGDRSGVKWDFKLHGNRSLLEL